MEEGEKVSEIISFNENVGTDQKELILNKNSLFKDIADIHKSELNLDIFSYPPYHNINNLTSNGGEIEIEHKNVGGILLSVDELNGNEITFKINVSSSANAGYLTLENFLNGNYNQDLSMDYYLAKGSDVIYVESKDDKTKSYLKLSDKSIKDLKNYYSIKENKGKPKFFSRNVVINDFNSLNSDYKNILAFKDNKEYIPKEIDFGLYSYKPIIRKYYLLRDTTEEEKDEFIKGIYDLRYFLNCTKDQLNGDTEAEYIKEIEDILQELTNLEENDKYKRKHYFERHELLSDKLKKLPLCIKEKIISNVLGIPNSDCVLHQIIGLDVIQNPIINTLPKNVGMLYKLSKTSLEEYEIPKHSGLWTKNSMGLDSNFFDVIQVGYNKKFHDTLLGLSLAHRVQLEKSDTINGNINSTSILGYLNKGILEVIPKISFINSNMLLNDRYKANYKTINVGIKTKLSKEFKVDNNFSITPTASLIYNYTKGVEYKMENFDTKYNGIHSLIGEMGAKVKLKDFYIKASILNEFLGDSNYSIKDTRDEIKDKVVNKDLWFNVGVGAEHKLGKDKYVYYSLEKEFGNKISNKLKVNLGFVF